MLLYYLTQFFTLNFNLELDPKTSNFKNLEELLKILRKFA